MISKRMGIGAAIGCLVLASAAQGATSPVKWLESATNEALGRIYDPALADRPVLERVRPLLLEHFDVETITRGAVGFPWRQFSAEDRERVTKLFSEVVMRTYASRFEPVERPVIKYGSAAELPRGRQEVATTITYAGQQYAVSYRLQSQGDTWRIYDVIAEGVSLVANYRAQFDSIIRKGGVSALIAALEENLKNSGGGE